MALLDKVADLNLYIGGLFTLRRKEALQNSGITHVLSVLTLPLDQKLFEGFVHKAIDVDDVDDENFLQHFPACVQFIQEGLDSGGGVLVHCAMGKSRSATAIIAYLITTQNHTPTTALTTLRLSRPIAEPNPGFMTQLSLWQTISSTPTSHPITPSSLESIPAYQRYLYQREIALSRACGQAPDASTIRFEDEHARSPSSSASSPDFTISCKKCRRPLANSTYLSSPSHTPPQNQSADLICTHYFLDPLSWMREELEKGQLEGRLECPKCRANVGKYCWQGMQCSCGEWVVPGISLGKGRVDRVVRRGGEGGGGIRMGPGVAGGNGGGGERKGGQENL